MLNLKLKLKLRISNLTLLYLLILLILLVPRKGEKMSNLLLRISYNRPKMLSSKFQSNIIKIKDFKINPINTINHINPIFTIGESKNSKPIPRNVIICPR